MLLLMLNSVPFFAKKNELSCQFLRAGGSQNENIGNIGEILTSRLYAYKMPYMPRIARVVVPDYPHHITQRGTNKTNIFFDDGDRRYFLQCLKDWTAKARDKDMGLLPHGQPLPSPFGS